MTKRGRQRIIKLELNAMRQEEDALYTQQIEENMMSKKMYRKTKRKNGQENEMM